MDHLHELAEIYPDTTIVPPSCGAGATHFILELFGKRTPPLEDIEQALDAGNAGGSTSLLGIRDYLENEGLEVYPLSISLVDLHKTFESAVAVLHAASCNGDGEDEAPIRQGHYLALVKHKDTFYVLDPPAVKDTSERRTSQEVAALAESIRYQNVALVVSDRPLSLPLPQKLSLAGILAITACLVVVALILRTSLRKFVRRWLQRDQSSL
ncbi:MAG TPA: hypothetical protein HPP77_00870 [Candidatus Hydrogenedentes bacterium]|nr:hypothetical protein [Candidatus Hydrogenedentota bacterium]HIJ74480.1 hypothetical protein [Candidatus Hydrogenedentota bacterium]